jgi:TM2 domain-containing membrane protein YozV
MESIEVEYLPKLKDYLEAYLLYDSKTTQRKIEKIISIIFILFGIILLSMALIYEKKIINIIISIVIIIIGIFDLLNFIDFGKIVIAIQFKNNNKLKFIQKIKFTENGLEYETQGIKSNIEWNFYKKYYEGENIFLLIYGNRQYSVIPKQGFNDKLNNFRKLLESELNNKKK